MPLHPQAAAIIEARRNAGGPPQNTMTPSAARAQMNAGRSTGPVQPVRHVEDRAIRGPGGALPVRIYRDSNDTGLPILVWFHGGGWVVGDLDQTDAACRLFAKESGAVVVSVDYRLAPECQFPGPVEDCYAATQWAVDAAAELHGDPEAVAVGGASAGANLAAAVALLARDRGGPRLVHQSLIYPVCDYDFTTASYRENGGGQYGLSTDSMQWYWHHYIGATGEYWNPYASPARANSLAGLPRAHVITAEYDPLRDEGEAYADRLVADGVPTVATRYPGMTHGFFNQVALIDDAMTAIREAAQELLASVGNTG